MSGKRKPSAEAADATAQDPTPIELQSTAGLPSTTPGTAPPAFFDQMTPEDAGAGLSTAAEDNLVPMMRILQTLSPQAKANNPDYIPGAKPGDIWLRNSDYPPISGAEGILFQPCYFSQDYVEWIPRSAGGGLVARHAALPTEARCGRL